MGLYCACNGTVVGWSYAERNCVKCQANLCEGDKATDQRDLAERKWKARTIAAKPQQPCDHGLFSDQHLQSDLVTLARKDRT